LVATNPHNNGVKESELFLYIKVFGD